MYVNSKMNFQISNELEVETGRRGEQMAVLGVGITSEELTDLLPDKTKRRIVNLNFAPVLYSASLSASTEINVAMRDYFDRLIGDTMTCVDSKALHYDLFVQAGLHRKSPQTMLDRGKTTQPTQ